MGLFQCASNDVEGARKAVSMIVGRDTNVLDRNGIIRAAVETVAENTSDGVTAPVMYMALGGAVLGFFYKAANTMDSMIGYKNEKYKDIGFFAAKLDDVLNYFPSRITAFAMISCTLTPCFIRALLVRSHIILTAFFVAIIRSDTYLLQVEKAQIFL